MKGIEYVTGFNIFKVITSYRIIHSILPQFFECYAWSDCCYTFEMDYCLLEKYKILMLKFYFGLDFHCLTSFISHTMTSLICNIAKERLIYEY
jgi:hypothetical protein